MEQVIAKLSDFKSSNIFTSDIKTESGKKIQIVLFLNSDGTVSALENRCSHADIELSGGVFEYGEIECPAHGARFDVKTGKNLCMPAVTSVKSFSTRVEDDRIMIEI